jgi:hypothetical protein
LRANRLRTQPFTEIPQLIGICLPFSRAKPLNDNKLRLVTSRELLEQCRFADAPPSTTCNQGCRGLLQQKPKGLQLLLTANKHDFSP